MKVAVCQLNIKFEKKDANILSVENMICMAAKKKADIIFFPEMTFTGFSMIISLTGEKNNESIRLIKDMIRKYEIAVGFGWVKCIGKRGENHYTVINKDGYIIADYIKIHPFSYSDEDKYYNAGNNIVTFELCGKKVGVFICYDLRFPEIFQISSKESELIVVAANWPEKRISHWNKLLEARALENQCWILGVNCCGEQQGIIYNGCSRIVTPLGDTIESMENIEGLLFCDINNESAEYRKSFPVKNDRKNQLYKSLL